MNVTLSLSQATFELLVRVSAKTGMSIGTLADEAIDGYFRNALEKRETDEFVKLLMADGIEVAVDPVEPGKFNVQDRNSEPLPDCPVALPAKIYRDGLKLVDESGKEMPIPFYVDWNEYREYFPTKE